MVNGNAMTAYTAPAESNQMLYYSAKEEMYEAAEIVAFCDLLHAGYTSQAIRNTGILAGMAVDAANRCPEYSREFKRLVDKYVDFATGIIGGM